MERKLASLQVIKDIRPIEGADNIVQARVMGWSVVVKKGEFAPGDLCVFFEIDSLLPDGPAWSEFMRSRGFRVKTVKLRGVLSQGIALPVNILGEALPAIAASGMEVGTDVSETLGVRKYELEQTLGKPNAAGSFPPNVPKTDEIRLQSALGVLDEIRGKPFYVTTKLDGSSATFFRDFDGSFVVCSRNLKVQADPPNGWWKVAERYDMANRLPPGFAVQGELCGPGIQKNRLGLTDCDVFMFNVYDVANARYLSFQEFVRFCEDCGLKTVPIDAVYDESAAAEFDHSLDAWLERAKGEYKRDKIYDSRKKVYNREGIVIRPLVETYSRTLKGRLSFKVINNDFLLKDED